VKFYYNYKYGKYNEYRKIFGGFLYENKKNINKL